jgi:(p)ppGpp synthase/HD superfamily hydrolase
MKIEEMAIEFATRFHGNQKRKYTSEPYINHCLSVAEIVKAHGGTTEMICAAILHDTVEDTTATLDDIKREFGNNIMQLVWQLTDEFTPEKHPDKNRKERKRLECERIAGIRPEAKTIKLADLIDNSSSIVQHDPKFAATYLKEKGKMLEVLIGGDKELYRLAVMTYNKSLQKLIAS